MTSPDGANGGAPREGPDWDTNAAGVACIPNIGPRERKRRLAVGIVSWALGAAALLALLLYDAPRLWRLALFIPLWAGGVGFFQFREKT